MTKPVIRKMAVDCLLWRFMLFGQAITSHGPTATGLPCSICGEPLLPGQQIQFDHIHADVHGGEHTYKNLRPVHYDPCHKGKTAQDIKDNAKVKRLKNPRKSSRPMKNSGRKIPSRPFSRPKC